MRFFIAALATVAALAYFALLEVKARHEEVDLGFQIAKADAERRALEDELKQIQITRSVLLDPNRLEPIALQAGFRVPGPEAVVVIRRGDGH